MNLTEPQRFTSKRLLDAALSYAARGWHVFPVYGIVEGVCTCRRGSECNRAGKHPHTQRGHLEASTDAETIRRWWQRWPLANVAIATGPSNLVVLDVDPRNDGDESLADLPELPDTIRALTGGGGQHHFFGRPEGKPRIKSGELATGIDLKADGGYVIAAPSGHLSGQVYAWDAGAHPDDGVQLQELPDWLVERLDSTTTVHVRSGAVTDGFLGAAFQAAGLLGRPLGPNKSAVQCPWEGEHSEGRGADSSTVVFAPSNGHRIGKFHCSHSHCVNRSLRDVVEVLSDEAKRAAKEQLGLDEYWDPCAPKVLPVESDNEDWETLLRRNDRNSLTRDPGNATLILSNDSDWKDCLTYDEFTDRTVWASAPPKMPGLTSPRVGDELEEHHWIYVQHWLAKARGVSFPKAVTFDAMIAASKANPSDSLQAHFRSIEWDRKQRISTWLHDYFGVRKTPYAMAVGRWWLISAMARAFAPGCQADHVLILEGKQDVGKSSAAKILGSRKGESGEWYLASLPELNNDTEAAKRLQGNFIVELGELDAVRGVRATRVKDWITRAVDVYRPSYGRIPLRRPRRCVFIGTTNETHYLTDPTGARRFWPVRTIKFERERLAAEKDQLFAEALAAYDSGEQWWPTQEYKADLKEEQDQRFDFDSWESRIDRWAKDYRGPFSVEDVLGLALGIDMGKWTRSDQTRVGSCLRRLGYVCRQIRTPDGGRIRQYERGRAGS